MSDSLENVIGVGFALLIAIFSSLIIYYIIACILNFFITKLPKKYNWPRVLTLITIIFLIIIFSIDFIYQPSSGCYGNECRALIVSWCNTCKVSGWIGKIKVNQCLSQCSNTYFNTGWKVDDDCNVINAKEICAMVGIS